MSGNDFLNKNVLRWRWKVDRDVTEVISSGSWFHVWGPETENAIAADRRQFNSWYCQTIGDCRAQSQSARQVSDTDKWSQISRCHTTHDFVGQQSDLVLYALWCSPCSPYTTTLPWPWPRSNVIRITTRILKIVSFHDPCATFPPNFMKIGWVVFPKSC